MRRLTLFVLLSCLCGSGVSQLGGADEVLLLKTRSLYDAPFTRGLISFDCSVQFDWKKHFVDLLGTMPAAALPAAERLQMVQHRVFVDRSGGVVSAIPKAPDLGGIEHAKELEAGLEQIISQGLNAWTPFSTNVILPVKPTQFSFRMVDSGYKLEMSGPGVAATLLLDTEMRLTSGVSSLPQPVRLTTEFTKGPDGFLLSSVRTGPTTETSTDLIASFAFTYQTVEGFRVPSTVTVSGSMNEVWHYSLNDCQARRGVTIEVGLPKR